MTTFVDAEIQDLDLEVKEGENLEVRLASFHDFPSVKIHVKVQKNGTFDGAFADFSSGKGKAEIVVELLGEGAKATWHYAGISSLESEKIVNASIVHLAPNTYGRISQYGIAMDVGRLSFFGASKIEKGAYGSDTAQKEKIIVFDQGAVGKCSPELDIDENDVVASHSAIVGKLPEEHMFYLLSRGLEESVAKRLLVLGYLRPVLAHFEGELAERISAQIEEGFLS